MTASKIKNAPALLLLPLLSLLMASCHLETSGNGRLDGMWHMERIDTIGAGTIDLSQQRLYWSFQAKLMELSDKDGANRLCLMRFNHSGTTLSLSEPYLYDRESGEGDHPLSDAELLKPYGISAVSVSFDIEKLSSSRMILNDGTLRIYFKKF